MRVEVRGGRSFCIDRTEVTRGQYTAFLASGAAVNAHSRCAWNDSFTASTSGDPELPVTGVDWCDAHAFCSWAGKRLCGRIGGATLLPAQANDPATEMRYACSAGGTRTFAYGHACGEGVDGGSADVCAYADSSFIEAQAIDLRCGRRRETPRNERDVTIGFRCCGP